MYNTYELLIRMHYMIFNPYNGYAISTMSGREGLTAMVNATAVAGTSGRVRTEADNGGGTVRTNNEGGRRKRSNKAYIQEGRE